MSHLLRSVNPEAADAIQPDPERQALPDVGDVVRYHMRQGWARDGRTIFPALVQGHGPGDTLMLTVVIDGGDLVDEQHVEQIGVGKQFHVWERPTSGVRPLVERLEQPAGLLGEVKSLESAIFGDFDRPRISVIDILQDFENRLRAVKQENDALRALLDGPPAGAEDDPAPKPKRAAKKKVAKKKR